MQHLPVYLYQNTIDAILDLDSTIRGANRVMYQRDLKIQKGIKNQVRIQFKNSDQKKVKIYSTQTFVFSMFDAINQRILLEKRLDVLDTNNTSTKGLALLTLSESDTMYLDRTSYKYSVRLLDSDGSYTPAYSDTYYGVAGTLHLSDDIAPVLKDSTEVTVFNKTWNDATQKYQHTSGNLYASPEFNGNSAIHTIAMYMTGYKGDVYIEGTLDNSPTNTPNYSQIATVHYTGFTGVDYLNFQGVYSYIRVKHVPSTAPAEVHNDNPSFFGSFDKILYRS